MLNAGSNSHGDDNGYGNGHWMMAMMIVWRELNADDYSSRAGHYTLSWGPASPTGFIAVT